MKKLFIYDNENYEHKTLYIDDPITVIKFIQMNIKSIITRIQKGVYENDTRSININRQNDLNVEDIEVFEKGIVITIANTKPSINNTGEDFSQTKLFITNNDEIYYAYSSLDHRLKNNENYEEEINSTIEKLYSLMGEKQILKRPEKKSFFNARRVKIEELTYNISLAKMIGAFAQMIAFNTDDIEEINTINPNEEMTPQRK